MMIKKTGSFLLRYILILFIAGLATGLLSLILKVSRVTVQGPTTISTVSGIITYYIAVSLASFFLFKSSLLFCFVMVKGQHFDKLSE